MIGIIGETPTTIGESRLRVALWVFAIPGTGEGGGAGAPSTSPSASSSLLPPEPLCMPTLPSAYVVLLPHQPMFYTPRNNQR